MTSEAAALRGPLRKRESSIWVREANDWYVEPQWCSERLFALERFDGRIWDPACGMGRIVCSAEEAGLQVIGTDIEARVPDAFQVVDFFECDEGAREQNIVSNPPFGVAEKFVAHALALAERKVAMLLPANWIQGQKRSRWLATTPLYRVWFICPRPSMPPGHIIQQGSNPGNGTTDYAWFVWLHGYEGPATIRWLYRGEKTVRVRETGDS